MARLILLDRDGVINFDSPDYIKSPDEWRAIPGSIEAIASLKTRGRIVAVCTNQRGIARGKFSLSDLEAIHAKMSNALADAGTRVDAVTFCPHAADAGCNCRKPKPGMLLSMMERFQVTPGETIFVGDTIRDLEAAAAAGCAAVLVRSGKGPEEEAEALRRGLSFSAYDDLAEFARAMGP
jgi:D-glycero-D-manno-heptose 1,7-bisphosphate phosphatase